MKLGRRGTSECLNANFIHDSSHYERAPLSSHVQSEPMTTDLDPEDEEDEDDSEDALSEFDFLGSGEDGEGAGEARISGDGRELGTLLP